MTPRERTHKVVELLGIDIRWAARLGSLLYDTLGSHGVDESAFEEAIGVVGRSWLAMGVARDPEILVAEGDHRLELVGPGRYFLDVLCGTVGMYSVLIRLDQEQIAAYESGGREYVKRLARSISRNEIDCSEETLL